MEVDKAKAPEVDKGKAKAAAGDGYGLAISPGEYGRSADVESYPGTRS